MPASFFLLVTLPFWSGVPALDPLVTYDEAVSFDLGEWSESWGPLGSTHPPLLFVLVGAFFRLAGRSPFSYRAAGFACFSIAVLAIAAAARELLDEGGRTLLTALIFCNPLVVVSFFDLTHDGLILTCFAVALFCFARAHWLGLTFALAAFAFTKETGLVAIPAFVLAWLATAGREAGARRARLALLLLPAALCIAGWQLALRALGGHEWGYHAHNLGSARGERSFSFLLRDLVPSQLFSRHLARNLYHLFVFNFQWVYSLLALALVARIPWRESLRRAPARRLLALLGAFALLYTLLALSYHTYAIPRYVVPVLPALLLPVAWGISALRRRWVRAGLSVALGALMVVSTWTSVDPLSAPVETRLFMGQPFYAFQGIDGVDAIFYNRTFFRLEREQTRALDEAVARGAGAIGLPNCAFVFDEIAALASHPAYYDGHRGPQQCVDPKGLSELADDSHGERLYIPLRERDALSERFRARGFQVVVGSP